MSTLRLLFATQPLRSFLSTQNRASVARRPVRSRGVEARVHHVKRRPSTRRRAVGGHWMARSNAQPRSPATPGPRRPLRSSVRQTTTMVVRGLGRASLCLSLSACLSVCPRLRLRVSLSRPARPLPSPEQYPASSSPLGPPLVLAPPLHDRWTTSGAGKRPGIRGTKSLGIRGTASPHLPPAPAGRGFVKRNSRLQSSFLANL